MKISYSYSDCFYQVRNYLRQVVANDYMCVQLFSRQGVMSFDLICTYADDLTAYNDVSGLPFFVNFKKFDGDA